MKIYPLKNKIVISWTSDVPIALKLYVENGQILSDIYHERNIQKREIDCGIPLFNSELFGRDVVNHLLRILKENKPISLSEYTPYNDAQIELYNSLKASTPLRELFLDCPNLAWILVMKNYYSHSFHVLQYTLRFKRKIILSMIFNTPPCEKNIKLIKKTCLLNGRNEELRWLSIALENNNLIESYKHKEQVTIQELYLSNRFPVLSGSVLLSELSKERKESLREYKVGMVSLYKIVIDSIRIGENIGIKNAKFFVLNCTNRESVIAIHNKWIQKLKETTRYIKEDIPLPRPSLITNENIVFVETINKLIKEGREMDHCIASYKDKVISGESYVYSVISPQGERATLELILQNGKYLIKEMKCIHNGNPSNLTWAYVNTWLKDENKLLLESLKLADKSSRD
ncbi:PcfJ domain-containing protein [Pectobacterium polaris]|nr:PcfJ domain-containing protein [Pectobacterium polaris]MBN3080020.1 PcfJ domain-containing protein [Pectobacterium polaris]